MIPILPSHAWVEFRGLPKTKGLNQTTHLASIKAPDGRLHRCYVKMVPPDWPTPLTEAIAWLLAEALDLPRPMFAAIVTVPIPKLRQHMPLDQHWLKHNEYLAFCAEVVDGKSPVQGWRWTAWYRLKKFYQRQEVRRISAFDQWLENQDRHAGNLLKRANGECVPIDNEHVLYSLLWASVGIAFGHNSLLNEATKYMSPEGLKRFKVEMANFGKQHEQAFNIANSQLEATVKALVRDPVIAETIWQTVSNFLQARAKPEWMPAQLGVIA